MRISVIGAGYVGLVTGTCLAEMGHQVRLIEIDAQKVSQLRKAELPIHEPQLQPLLARNLSRKCLSIHHQLEEGLLGAEVVYLALPTPAKEDGSSDLQHLLGAVEELAPHIKGYTIIVTKSTIPVGTTQQISELLQSRTREDFDVVSNPEFLREGTAVYDFLRPQRIVIGTSSERARLRMKELYASFTSSGCPILFMDEASAEMSKYAANAFLATKISFINEIAYLCAHLGANIKDVEEAISMDKRIGKSYLRSGLGYGGSCLPKDIDSLLNTSEQLGIQAQLLRSVREINTQQRLILWKKAKSYFQNELSGLTFAIWGLSFKPGTDDIREAPSLSNITQMIAEGVSIRVYDPAAMSHARAILKQGVYFAKDPYDAIKGVDALFIMTEWPIFNTLDLSEMKKQMRRACVFDGRGIYEPEKMHAAGIQYHTITTPS